MDRRHQLRRDLRQQFERLDGLLTQEHGARFDFLSFRLRLRLGDALHIGGQGGALADEVEHAKALDALHDHVMAAVWRG